jgi:shikimate dehydrogenase
MADKGAPMLTGLIGRGIGGSMSPRLHQGEGDALGLRLTYSLFDFDALGWPDNRLPELVAALKLTGFRGVNVTYPFKQAIIPLLDEISPQARAIGAVNTVIFEGGRATGHNTDVAGFARGLTAHVPLDRLDQVLQIGAGGAGAAAAHALLESGVGQLTIAELDEARRTSLVTALQARFGTGRVTGVADPAEAIATASGVVNATPVGMARLPGTPLDPALLVHKPWVYDVIYVPVETELLRAAAALGCTTINGVTMVIHQAAVAFGLFTGLGADTDRMRRVFAH